jgi:hypothetical protein
MRPSFTRRDLAKIVSTGAVAASAQLPADYPIFSVRSPAGDGHLDRILSYGDTAKNELINALKAASEFPATGSSEDRGMGSDSWGVVPSNAGLGSDALKAASEFPATASTRSSKETPNPQDENRALFIAAMPDPARRHIAFNVVERNCRERFAEGADGVKLYVRLLTYVRLTSVAEAVDEFERRFRPMLDKVALEEWQTITAPFKRD